MITSFDPHLDLILIDVDLTGPRKQHTFVFAFDTACSQTIITHEALSEIGYQARHGEETSTVTTAIGRERGYFLRVARIEALGHAFDDFRGGVHDLHADAGIDGLLGLSFLRHFKCEIDFRASSIQVAQAT